MADVKAKVEPGDDANSVKVEIVPGQPSVRLNWTHRALGKTGNVLQTLLNRQLGLPFYSRSEEAVCSYFNEKRIGRQLISKRGKSLEGHGENSVYPAKVKFQQTDMRQKTNQSFKVTADWAQLELSMPGKTKVGLVDGKLWKRYNEGQGGSKGKFTEEFYALDVHNFGLQLVSRSCSIGKLKDSCPLIPRALSTASTSTYLMTLMEPCYLRAYDMIKRKVSKELKLNLDITVPPLKRYAGVDICESTGKIFVLGTSERELVKAVVILDFPPNWSKVGIIHIDKLQMKLNVGSGICFIVQDRNLHLTTWPFIMENVQVIPPTGRSPEASLSVKFEGRLSEMPRLINTILFQTESPYAMFIDTVVPLIYGTAKAGMKFFLPVHLDKLIPPPSVYEFHKMIQDQEVDVTPFPDNSQRVLIFTESNQYEVVTFKFEFSGDAKVVKPCVSHPFNYWDEFKTSRKPESPVPTTSRSAKPKRACATNTNKAMMIPPEKKSILGITYCDVVDLLAILIAHDEEFIVILYDPFDLSVFKALPPVRIWPAEKNGDPNIKRESIRNVDFGLEPDFIFIEFGYSKDCKPSREVFCFRLLSESVN